MVSICLPNYNRAHLLPQVIESIINQTYKDWELIVVDDGSTDFSKEILKYFERDKIKVIFTKHKGISSARKTAFKASKGEYIAICDSDTIMVEDKLKESLAFLKKSKTDIVYSGAYAIFNDQPIGTFMPEDINKVIKEPKDILKPNQVVPNYTVLAKRKCFDDKTYRDDFVVNDDLWTIYYWYKKGYKFTLLNKYLTCHISDLKNVSSSQDKLVKQYTKKLQEEEQWSQS